MLADAAAPPPGRWLSCAPPALRGLPGSDEHLLSPLIQSHDEVRKRSFQTTVPRPTVEVLLPDGRILCGPRNRPLASFLNKLPEWTSHDPIMGAVVNGELRELTRPVELDSRVRLVRMSDPDGSGIYRRSITFLLEAAFEDTFPAADISVDHSLSSGGFYCSVINRAPLSKEELAAVEARMKELVKADLPFERQVVPLPDAISYFQSKGQHEKVQLLQFRTKGTLVLYKLGDRCDYHHGFMVPSTGYLHWFALTPMNGGFALRFPRRRAPNELPPLADSKKLLATFRRVQRLAGPTGHQERRRVELRHRSQAGQRTDSDLRGPPRAPHRRARPLRHATLEGSPRRARGRAVVFRQNHFLQAPHRPAPGPGHLTLSARTGQLFPGPRTHAQG